MVEPATVVADDDPILVAMAFDGDLDRSARRRGTSAFSTRFATTCPSLPASSVRGSGLARQLAAERDAARLGQLPATFDDGGHDGPEIGGLGRHEQRRRAEPGERQQVVDQVGDAIDLVVDHREPVELAPARTARRAARGRRS